MTCEADVLTTPDEISLLPVEADVLFQIIPNVILREESFGATVAATEAGTVYVDKETLSILKALRGRDSFTANGVATEFQVQVEPTREVLARLESQHLIKKGGMLR